MYVLLITTCVLHIPTSKELSSTPLRPQTQAPILGIYAGDKPVGGSSWPLTSI